MHRRVTVPLHVGVVQHVDHFRVECMECLGTVECGYGNVVFSGEQHWIVVGGGHCRVVMMMFGLLFVYATPTVADRVTQPFATSV